jgi:hypothetical protein
MFSKTMSGSVRPVRKASGIASLVMTGFVLAAGLVSAPPAAAAPHKDVETNVHCGYQGHITQCGKFTGSVQWPEPYDPFLKITISGTLWSTHGSAYVYLKYKSGIVTSNREAGKANAGQTVDVHKVYTMNDPPGDITVTVCSTFRKWHCGATVDP